MFMRSLSRHLNSTVFRGPDDEGGSGASGGTDNDIVDTGSDADVGGDVGGTEEATPQEPLTVREQIKKSMAEAAGEQPEKAPQKDPKTGRFARKAAKEGEAAPADPAQQQQTAPPADDIPAPASLTPEAKAAWATAPKEIKEAFIKREADMQRGVDELKQKYSLIDQAIAPHTDALRQMNATPQEAVNRMFLWFKALGGTPQEAFPALAQSMGLDWAKLVAGTQGGQQQPQQQGGDPAAAPADDGIPEPVKQYIGKLEQQLQTLGGMVQQVGGRFQTLEESAQQQNMARTSENLKIWSKDKPHFDQVRTEMASLLQSGMIPLLPDGQVDLDTAYERAIYFNPDVRALVLAEQQQANQQVQQEAAQVVTTANQQQVEKARKASVSIPARNPPGPGNPPAGGVKKKAGQKMSVRDSLKAAMAELRDQ
jgi:hemoglobin-like flavoprotein